MRFPLSLDATFLKKSYARRMFYGWWKLVIAALVAIASAVLGRADGHLSIWSIFALTALGFMVLVFGAAWYHQSKALDEWLRAQGAAPVVYEFSDESVESTSAVGSTKLKWDAFRGLKITDDDMLLLFPRAGALTLPTQQVPADAVAFAKARFLAHGKKVEDKRKTANQAPEPTAPSGRGSS